jgi:hypothetical protein
MENYIDIDGKRYEPNKRYPVEGEPNKVFYYKKYKNKEGNIKWYKYYTINSGRPRTGRPVTTRKKIEKIIKKCSSEQIEVIYKLLQNIRTPIGEEF